MLTRIELPENIDSRPLPETVDGWIAAALGRIQVFQDCWQRNQIEQFVAADYAHVFRVLDWTRQSQPLLGNRFLEWGCGFAVVCSLAAHLGFDAIGIEAESELLDQGRLTVESWDTGVELICGNFLPPGSERLADDPMLPSLGHDVVCGYAQLGMELSDFSIVYSYPWPGEDDFHELVFEKYAERGALLMQFCGPNDVRLWRKT